MQQRLVQRHTQLDMDPLNNAQQRAWWLLYANDRAEVHFSGTRLGFLTMIGPDAGIVQCEVDGGRWTCRLNLLDKWAYFWRLAVVALLDDLPPGPHVAIVTFLPEKPDARALKRKPTGAHWEAFRREGKDHKLWLMHWLIEEESEMERALTRASGSNPGERFRESNAGAKTSRVGGVSGVATGGRKADP